jgi:hypothetical protein
VACQLPRPNACSGSLLRTGPAIRREFVELPAQLDSHVVATHVVAMYHEELLTEIDGGEQYNFV